MKYIGLINLPGRFINPISLFFHGNSIGIVYNSWAKMASTESYKDTNIDGEEYG
jgi:hypothetical protein